MWQVIRHGKTFPEGNAIATRQTKAEAQAVIDRIKNHPEVFTSTFPRTYTLREV